MIQLDQNFKDHSFIDINEKWFGEAFSVIAKLKTQLNDPQKSIKVQNAVGNRSTPNGIRSLFFAAFGKANNLESKIGDEYKGLYLFGEPVADGRFKPAYVGISRTMIRRFRGHTIMQGSNNASWTFLMAKKDHPEIDSKEFEMRYRSDFQKKIWPYNFTMVPIENDFEMHILEGMAACVLKAKWNSFSTH